MIRDLNFRLRKVDYVPKKSDIPLFHPAVGGQGENSFDFSIR